MSWNFYIGWYGDAPEDTAAFLEDMLKWKNSAASKGGKGKPVIMSEFGAGAHSRLPGSARRHWTEEYQARVLDENLKVYLNILRWSARRSGSSVMSDHRGRPILACPSTDDEQQGHGGRVSPAQAGVRRREARDAGVTQEVRMLSSRSLCG